MSRLLALDQASKVTGWAIFEDGELKSYGKISLDDPNTDIRLVQLRQGIQTLVADYNIDEVIFEDIQQQNNVAIMFRPLRSWQKFMELYQSYYKKSRFLIQQFSPHLGNLLQVLRVEQEQNRKRMLNYMQNRIMVSMLSRISRMLYVSGHIISRRINALGKDAV